MAEATDINPPAAEAPKATPTAAQTLGSATYEVIRQRLQSHAATLRERMNRLDERRREVFGSIESKLLRADRIVTEHNCVPRDMIQLGEGHFLFGFNVRFGLKKEIELGDVFAAYRWDEGAGAFKDEPLDALNDRQFITDFKRLYNVYEKTVFRKFSVIGENLFMVFGTSPALNDIAVFKWSFVDGKLRFADGRAEAEYRRVGYPSPHDFRWLVPGREAYRYGDHPHVSIDDRVFVECVGGNLTIKIEDNTATGEGIHSEPVDDRHQKVDDAEIAYATHDHLILLKVRPYKETVARYFIFNEKLESVVRVDSIGESCVRLPEEQGLIFPDGCYLGTGELKRFESRETGLVFERVIHAPNGEDSLYVFYGRETGDYVLLPYRLISQKVEERITCHGFSLFPNGHLLLFRADTGPQKHHLVQLRQTPFHRPGFEPPGRKDAFLYQVGNKDVVRCLAECNETLTLARAEQPYSELYVDLVRRCETILDAHPWLSSEDGCEIDDAVRALRDIADKAVDEFDKVRRLQQEAVQRVRDIGKRCEDRFQEVSRAGFNSLNDYVANLSALRHLRGELITLKELRYVDTAALDKLEATVIEKTGELAGACVNFLLKPESLDPYRKQATEQLAAVEKVGKVADGRKIEQAVVAAGGELEMLIEIVNSLNIEDATETTRFIDGITAVYSTLNQVKAALKKRLQSLVAAEGAAQFAAQMKLLGQSAASYLDLCDTPAKCDEYLNRLTVQLEELEGAFADFEEYTVQLAERRTELYEAFEQRKIALVEQRNRRSGALLTAAERILKVIQNRLAGFKSVEDINTYVASDAMVARVRDMIAQLLALDDAVKADDLQGRLKSVQQEAVRQLKDRQDLFQGGEGVIQLGKHAFNVNTQPLDLTVVFRDGAPCLHLTSTKYFEEIKDETFLATRDVWDQEVISENRDVYRAEYLAWRMLNELQAASGAQATGAPASSTASPRTTTNRESESDSRAVRDAGAPSLEQFLALSEDEQLTRVQAFMGGRYQEGYVKGVHDLDGARILKALASTHLALSLARYAPDARACAVVYWLRFCPTEIRALWTAKLKGFAERNRLFPGDPVQRDYVAGLSGLISEFIAETELFESSLADPAGEYLFHELIGAEEFVVGREADQLASGFRLHLAGKGREGTFRDVCQSLKEHPASELQLVRDWVRGYLLGEAAATSTDADGSDHPLRRLEEVAAMLFCGDAMKRLVVESAATTRLEGLRGGHARIQGSTYVFDYLDFQRRLSAFDRDVVPRFETYHRVKQQLVDREREKLRLDEFKPRVLGSFVRNQLIDRVYLPVIGDNLAKQVGAAGAGKRTDLMGLLLLISPPGYGKTTLMEYLASRLGIVFVKINGPALGHHVTSLDPEEAPNAAAREEIHRLNLALEMGDNTMLYLDDIQHCSAEFLQKFISLCDAQRKIEGVWRGRPRTYDLRGRKVVVVMAGNPYTESGLKFRIPDMLANRADTYNLGDIIGGSADHFKASYLENSITSNAALAPLANQSQRDIRAFIRLAETGERDAEGFEGAYSSQEVEEITGVMRKLVQIRDVILKVNLEYIRSAAQADEFRTEPPFKLQGSYRNMNKLAEKVVPIMNDDEVRELILDHYRGESQTLTTGAEANLLKFKELVGALNDEERERWDDIKKTFKQNTRAGDQADPVNRVVSRLSGLQEGLEAIQSTLGGAIAKPPPEPPRIVIDLEPVNESLKALRSLAAREPAETTKAQPVTIDLTPIARGLETLREAIAGGGLSLNEPTSRALPESSALVEQLNAGLTALREDLSRAITAVHSGAMADSVKSLMHEMEMIHSTLATLKDITKRQRDYLRSVEEMLVARAKEGTVEIQLTQEMLENERAFLERFHQVLGGAENRPEDESNDAKQ